LKWPVTPTKPNPSKSISKASKNSPCALPAKTATPEHGEPGQNPFWGGNQQALSPLPRHLNAAAQANGKEHAPLSARACVEHVVGVESTGEHENRAADRGCFVSTCSAAWILMWHLRSSTSNHAALIPQCAYRIPCRSSRPKSVERSIARRIRSGSSNSQPAYMRLLQEDLQAKDLQKHWIARTLWEPLRLNPYVLPRLTLVCLCP
jgi:hypothetical protein